MTQFHLPAELPVAGFELRLDSLFGAIWDAVVDWLFAKAWAVVVDVITVWLWALAGLAVLAFVLVASRLVTLVRDRGSAGPPDGLGYSQPETDLTSRKSSMPQVPPSRPLPDWP